MSAMDRQKKNIISIAYENLKQSGPEHLPNRQQKYNQVENLQEVVSFEERCNNFSLTPAEIRVIGEVAKGAPYKIIAQTLNISERTVNKHMENIFRKTQSGNKLELLSKLLPHFTS
jgi:DNA-binding CsgD family transcriptional regulator